MTTKHAAPEGAESRYRFLLGFLIERGVLNQYSNGTWRLRGIYGVDDSGLKGAGRTPEEALDNAIVAVNLDPVSAEKFWQETHAALTQGKQQAEGAVDRSQPVGAGLTDEAIMDAMRPFAKDGGRWPSDWVDAARAVLALSVAASAPAGWKLVPVEPSAEMLDKGAMEIAMNMQRVMTAERKAEHVYRAMLAASPSLPVSGDGKEGQCK